MEYTQIATPPGWKMSLLQSPKMRVVFDKNGILLSYSATSRKVIDRGFWKENSSD